MIYCHPVRLYVRYIISCITTQNLKLTQKMQYLFFFPTSFSDHPMSEQRKVFSVVVQGPLVNDKNLLKFLKDFLFKQSRDICASAPDVSLLYVASLI